MIRCLLVIALGLFALIVGPELAPCPQAYAAAAQPPATEAQPAPAPQAPDTSALSDRVTRIEGQVTAMEAANDRAATASEEASKSAQQVIGEVGACTKFVSGLIVLVVGGLGYLGYRELSDVLRRVRRTANEALEKALADLRGATKRSTEELERLRSESARYQSEMFEELTKFQERLQTDAEERLRATDQIALGAAAGRPDRQQLWSHAQALISSGNPERGIELLEEVLKLDLAANALDINVLNQLSGLLDRCGRYEEAVKYADMAIHRLPGDVGARFNKAVIEIHRGGSAGEKSGKRSHWRAALKSFDVARRLHKAGTRMNDVDHGKMWLFAGETAQYIADLEPTPQIRSDWLQKAGAWYSHGHMSLSVSLSARAALSMAQNRRSLEFWISNAEERLSRLEQEAPGAAAEGEHRVDIARLDNDIPFWREEDEVEFHKLVGSDEEGEDGEKPV